MQRKQKYSCGEKDDYGFSEFHMIPPTYNNDPARRIFHAGLGRARSVNRRHTFGSAACGKEWSGGPGGRTSHEEQRKTIVAGVRGGCPFGRFASHVYLTPSNGKSCAAAVGSCE